MAANLLEHALQMERHAEQLATGLAQAGAPAETVKVVTQCASVGRAMAKALGNKNQNPEAANQSPEAERPAEDRLEGGKEEPQERQRPGNLDDASKNMQAEYQRKRQKGA
jgi:hypothetical protein